MVKKIGDMFTRLDRIHERERDRQTDRRTSHDGIGRAYTHSIARQNLVMYYDSSVCLTHIISGGGGSKWKYLGGLAPTVHCRYHLIIKSSKNGGLVNIWGAYAPTAPALNRPSSYIISKLLNISITVWFSPLITVPRFLFPPNNYHDQSIHLSEMLVTLAVQKVDFLPMGQYGYISDYTRYTR